jgi:hypothetical protein
MKKSVKIVLAVLALILVAAGILGGVRYKQYLDEEQRKAEIAAFYANPNVVLTVTEENFSELDKYTDLQTLIFPAAPATTGSWPLSRPVPR